MIPSPLRRPCLEDDCFVFSTTRNWFGSARRPSPLLTAPFPRSLHAIPSGHLTPPGTTRGPTPRLRPNDLRGVARDSPRVDPRAGRPGAGAENRRRREARPQADRLPTDEAARAGRLFLRSAAC